MIWWLMFSRCFVKYLFEVFEEEVVVITSCYHSHSSDYHNCASSFIKAWTQVLRRFKSCSRRVGDSRWWGSLTMVRAGNKATPFVGQPYHKTIHHHQGTSLFPAKILQIRPLDKEFYKVTNYEKFKLVTFKNETFVEVRLTDCWKIKSAMTNSEALGIPRESVIHKSRAI